MYLLVLIRETKGIKQS